jgi:TPP-dependent pyruvate/acetoin dehydrogenase alpha subunit
MIIIFLIVRDPTNQLRNLLLSNYIVESMVSESKENEMKFEINALIQFALSCPEPDLKQ